MRLEAAKGKSFCRGGAALEPTRKFGKGLGTRRPMLSEDTTDCLALSNTATLMRLIDRGRSLHRQNLQDCPERSARVDDAIQLIP